MSQLPNPLDHRQAEYPIEELFLKRWSPRAMSGEAVSREQLMTLVEAARWAPSTYNEQEWRFLYALKEGKSWPMFFNFLVEANQVWCQNAAALVVVISHKIFTRNGKPNLVHTFDTGAAFQNFCLQGAAMGLVVHGMGGFDRGKAQRELEIPDEYQVEAMIAVGQPGDPSKLPEALHKIEVPTDRKPVTEISVEGKFSF